MQLRNQRFSYARRTYRNAVDVWFAGGAECGNFCDKKCLKTATEADVLAELDGDADIMARDKLGDTPLHFAAQVDNPANIQGLLEAGADAKSQNKNGKTP